MIEAELQRLKIIAANILTIRCALYRASSIPWHNAYCVDSRISVSHEHRFIYVRVPKAANTKLAHTIYTAVFGREEQSSKTVKQAFLRPSQVREHVLTDAIMNYFTFIFVRNPYRRVLSAYLDKIVNPSSANEFLRPLVNKRLSRNKERKISFVDFCRYLECGGINDDPHWVPQHIFVDAIGLENMDFVGKVENLNNDAQIALSCIFPERNPIQLSERPHRRHHASYNWYDYFDEECCTKIARLYKRDFDLFGYNR